MEKVLTNSQMRNADEYTINVKGIPSRSLMRRAGNCIAEEVEKVCKERRFKDILVICGTGNNGGDGYVLSRLLKERGYCVKVFSFQGKLSDDCAREKSDFSGAYTREIKADIIVDCIFGTGLAREVSGEFAEVINKINSSGAFVISADIPSGLNGDNGRVLGCAVKADITVVLAEYKAGIFLGDGPDYCGKVIKRDIGISCPEDNFINVYSEREVKRFYPERKRNTHKGTYGTANIIAGSDRYTGAAALAVEAALKSGCGYVKLTSTEKVNLALTCRFPQVIFSDEVDLSSQAIAVGMGCGVSERLYGIICGLLSGYGGTLIIDADGLNSLSKYGLNVLKHGKCEVILTPHIKEFSRLSGLSTEEILNDPVGCAEKFSDEYGVILLLKNSTSVIAGGGQKIINTRGTTALSKAGSGDMLSGYMCGCAARGLSPINSAVCASFTLGLAAELSSQQKTDYCAIAKDILKNLPNAVKYLTRQS